MPKRRKKPKPLESCARVVEEMIEEGQAAAPLKDVEEKKKPCSDVDDKKQAVGKKESGSTERKR